MGSRGPARMPTAIRRLHGETRPSRINRSEPVPRGGPRMPAGMSDAAKRVWRRTIRDYGETGVLTGADAEVFRGFCDAVARYEVADAALQRSGPLVRGARHGDLVKNPLHQIVRDNAVLMKTFARELGLSPAARTNLTGTDTSILDDPMEAFFRERPR